MTDLDPLKFADNKHEHNNTPKPETTQGLAAAGMMNILLEEENEDHETFPALDAIPSLFERGLRGPDSMHGHRYDKTNTVWAKFSEAEDTPQAERTEEQAELIADVAQLEEYAGYTTPYMDVFTPEELHELVEKLERLRGRDRSDFDDIEEEINNVILKNRSSMTSDIVGLANKGKEGVDGRKARQFKTIDKLAKFANHAHVSNMFDQDPRRPYIIPVRQDPDFIKDKNLVDLRNIYQFVATSHALETYAKRSVDATEARFNTFLENYDLIVDWYDEAKPGISQLPRSRDFATSLNGPTGFTRRDRPARSSVQFQFEKLIEKMSERRDGDDRSGASKSYRVDPVGAINLQLLIGHKVEAIRTKIDAGIAPIDEEIVPLDELGDLDF